MTKRVEIPRYFGFASLDGRPSIADQSHSGCRCLYILKIWSQNRRDYLLPYHRNNGECNCTFGFFKFEKTDLHTSYIDDRGMLVMLSNLTK